MDSSMVGYVADVVVGIRIELPLQPAGREHGGLGLHLLQAGEALRASSPRIRPRASSGSRSTCRKQLEHGRQRVALGLDRETQRADPAAPSTAAPPATAAVDLRRTRAERGAEAVQFVAQLLVAKASSCRGA